MGQPGFGHDPQSRAARVRVVGHASVRWLGAKSHAEAGRLNDALSKRRAESVRVDVERVLRREIPALQILPGTDGVMPNGVEVGSYGVGSREPVLNPAPARVSPHENNPVNRSVVVFIELVTTTYGEAPVSLPPRRISARTRFWYGQVESLTGGAVGVAGYFLRLRLRNSLSDKSVVYRGYIFGGGVGISTKLKKSDDKDQVVGSGDTDPIGGNFSRSNPTASVGPEFSFYTDKDMGFDDFQGQVVRLDAAKAALLVKASTQYITFIGLGSGAAMCNYAHSFGVGWPSLNACVASGAISREGANPGDWFEVEDSAKVPTTLQDSTNDGLILSFPTGKSEVKDMDDSDRKRLEDYVVRWARRI